MMTENVAPAFNTKQLRWLFLTLFLAILGYLSIVIWGGWDQVFSIFRKVGLKGVFLSLFLSLMNYALRFFRWQLFLKAVGFPLNWKTSLPIYLGGFALTTTPGKTGEAIRSVFLKEKGIPYKKSFAAFLAERFYDLIVPLLIALFCLSSHKDQWMWLFSASFVIFSAAYLLQHHKLLSYIEKMAKSYLPEKLSRSLIFLLETLFSFRDCFSYSILSYGLILGTLAWAAEGFVLYFLLQELGLDISLYSTQFIYAFSLLIGSLTFLPGGLGSTEAVMVKLLLVQGVTASIAVALTLVIRITTLWLSVFVGACLLPFLSRPAHR